MMIGCIILWGAIRLVRASVNILMESVPQHLNTDSVIETIKSVSSVQDVHDMHIWTITSGIYALSAHLCITDQKVSESADIVKKVNEVLLNNFNITHTTLQLENENCPTGLICQINHNCNN